MNNDTNAGNFNQFKGKIKEIWGRLTDDDIALYNGKKDQFFGKLQEKYGMAKEEAEKRIRKIEEATGCKSDSCDVA